jgi:uncharacterized membrane protein YhiD involved in acid resistance
LGHERDVWYVSQWIRKKLFRRLAVALAIGLLVGLERGWQTREEHDHQRTAGLRTFALTGCSAAFAV